MHNLQPNFTASPHYKCHNNTSDIKSRNKTSHGWNQEEQDKLGWMHIMS